ncbi:6-bladed beta-propeller [Acanthopleuribacter pedis]|uniref:6-bladed beta-propeller n=1 Tax=Acanthopleuribacter pedis TaxID=442870 RepID=A0A8J7Q6Z9_9BACT|nr:6-bladed beta-propeller [Acanthopleuribacter pedis]MBO1321727.1 6-bladed beta-propeller [Acanthopleuribacter pedis]
MLSLTLLSLCLFGPSAYPVEDVAGINSLAFTSQKELVLLDARDLRIYVFDADRSLKRQFGTKGQGPGEFQNPTSLCVLANDEIALADPVGRQIIFFDTEGKHLRTAKVTGFAIGDLVPAPNNQLLLTSTSATFLYMKMTDTLPKRFTLLDRRGKMLSQFGEPKTHEEFFLGINLNQGYPVWLGETLIYFSRIENEATVYQQGETKTFRYQVPFLPKSPDAKTITTKTPDGKTNFQMTVDADIVARGAVAWGKDRILLLRAETGGDGVEESSLVNLVVLNPQGGVEKVFPTAFDGASTLAVTPDGKSALVPHDGEESWELIKVALD